MSTTYTGIITALVTVRTTGGSGTCMASIMATMRGTATNQGLNGTTTTATDTVDFTAAQTIELRCRMTTAVAAATLTVIHGFGEIVKV